MLEKNPEIEALIMLAKSATIDTATVAKEKLNLQLENYIKEHHKGKISPVNKKHSSGSIGEYWITYVNKRQIVRSSLEELYLEIYKRYTGTEFTPFNPKTSYLIDTIFREWIKHLAHTRKSGKTVKEYIHEYEKYYAPYSIAQADIRRYTAGEWYDHSVAMIEQFQLTQKAYARLRTVINELYRYAALKGYVTGNPLTILPYRDMPYADAEKGGYNEVKAKPFPVQKREALIQWCQQYHDLYHCAIRFNIPLGMRFPELRGLLWEDVDFENNLIYVKAQLLTDIDKKTLQSKGTKRIERMKKGEAPRILPLLGDSLAALKEIREMHISDEYVFPPGHFRQGTYNNKIKDGAESLGLNRADYSAYSLRVLAITDCYYKSLDIKMAQNLAGHRSPEMTGKYIKDRTSAEDLRRVLASA